MTVTCALLPWQASLRSQLQPGFLWLSPIVATPFMQLAKGATANATQFPQPALVAEVLSGGGNAALTL